MVVPPDDDGDDMATGDDDEVVFHGPPLECSTKGSLLFFSLDFLLCMSSSFCIASYFFNLGHVFSSLFILALCCLVSLRTVRPTFVSFTTGAILSCSLVLSYLLQSFLRYNPAVSLGNVSYRRNMV